ncbi:EF-hand domain-containing protein [Asticcacaulis sp. DW145]|uniref:EF-hand domain-containing protein n=1 Tax=Asticcacaulis currens TaxID=2984210 RepID=A0ABT5IHC2_9CAUL|nr:EF-hand domain-containing protein [Asticcacaulis currens]MDC7695598.1 EF-hand domain-containing protein [Asticcacaulis currens]BEV11853.1 EF-hand domain-containing protein [Asticcacaulis sp. DW145]
MQIGSMSASAMSQMHAKMFSKIDANSDGGITLEEMTASASEKTKGRGGTEDSAKIAERFARMDSNSDGSVSEEEGLSVFQSQMSSQTMSGMLQAQEGGQDRPMGPPPGGAAGGGGGQKPMRFDALDTNQDGTVSLDEMLASSESDETEDTEDTDKTARLTELFSKMDADGDGSVTESEKSTFDEKRRAEGPPPPPMEAFAQTSESEDTASSATGTTVDEGTAARLAALTTQWIQSMTRVLADQVQSQTSVSVAA